MEIIKTFPGFNMEMQKQIRCHHVKSYYDSGQLVCYPGQPIMNTIIVLSGKINIYRENEDGNDFYLYQLGAGQACASTFSHHAFSNVQLKCKAIEHTEVILIPINYVQQWMSKYSCWNEYVINTFQYHINQLMQLMDLILYEGLDKRLEYYLKSQVKDDETWIKISHQEIANEMNTSREVISRLLKKMESKGQLRLSRNQIEWIR